MKSIKKLICVVSSTMCFGIFSFDAQAATFTVTNINDVGAGSLRQAVADAGAAAGDDEIIFDAAIFSTPRTISLAVDQLSIIGGGNLIISGPGVDFSEIVNPTVAPQQPVKYAVNVSNVQLTLRNLKLRGLIVSVSASAIIEQVRFFARGINNQGTTTINDSVISNCGGNPFGGGVFNTGTIFINRSTIADNSARGGGGIYASNDGNVTVNNSIIRDNRVSSVVQSHGGGIFQSGSSMTINNSIVRDNMATGTGGGIASIASSLNIYNSTVTRNSAGSNGFGGIQASGGQIINSTVVGNFGLTDASTDSNLVFGNSIIGSFNGFFNSLGYNIIGNTTNTAIIGVTTGNQLNVNPQLAPLANNGGTTETLALLPTSPAINAGSNALAVDAAGNSLRFDQRGDCFRRIVGGAVDIGAFEVQASANPVCSTQFDFDGDRRADYAVFRPSNGTWYLQQSQTGFAGTRFGFAADRLAPADYDGDGRTDIAVFRDGIWYLLRSAQGFTAVQFGQSGDTPVPADYDGDGRADVALFRDGFWYILQSSNNQFRAVQFGISTDKTVPADYDGDGKIDVAVYRDGIWYWLQSSDNNFRAVRFGVASDKTVAADYDGDGRADPAVYRDGTWYLLRSAQGFAGLSFGAAADKPVAADYDGDGRADTAVWRVYDGTFYLLRSANNSFAAFRFGASEDMPVASIYVR